MLKRFRLLPLAVVLGITVLVLGAARTSPRKASSRVMLDLETDLAPAIETVDKFFEADWKEHNLLPATVASEHQVLRRLFLALMGTIPSLEEIREFDSDLAPDRLQRWTQRILRDSRFRYYFAERLARGLVGTEEGQFLVFRRDRFSSWLRDCLEKRRPWNEMVREMIADTGLWTDQPQTNFISAAVANDELDENKLAGRTVRAFLGQRIDCAQCHDHPFDHWKQGDFEGLAAFYGQVDRSVVGIQDFSNVEYKVLNRKTKKEELVQPSVPFHSEWLPESGTRRERLAAWVTHPENRRLERAIANRIWGLMFGKAFIDPVDGLSDPPEESKDLLDILGADFRTHRYDLTRLIQVIAGSRPFNVDSAHPAENDQDVENLKSHWAVFPLIRLRPEQMIGSILQAGSISTIDQNSHLLLRMVRFFRENDFVKEYGDLGENELTEQAGTIPQALQRMNSELINDLTKAEILTTPGRLASMSPTATNALETVYLITLTRLPSPAERTAFLPQLEGKGNVMGDLMEDLFWSLLNSPEFAWNH